MFANLKNKLIEEVKASPSKFQQLAQQAQAAVSSSTPTPSSGSGSDTATTSTTTTNENFFSITEEDTPQNTPLRLPFTGFRNRNAAATATPHSNALNNGASTGAIPRTRKLSNSSMASDVSFRLPTFDATAPATYHLQSDLESEYGSEFGDDVTSPHKLEVITKEKLFEAYKRSLERYNKYRVRYTDLVKQYKELERDSSKARAVLIETQDKALRRINELREQCVLEQGAKAHLEQALRVEMDDLKCKIQAYETKLKVLGENPENIKLQDENALPAATDTLIDLISTADDKTKSTTINGNENDKVSMEEKDKIETTTLQTKIKTLELELQERDEKLKEMNESLNKAQHEIEQLKKQEEENALLLAQTKQAIHTELENKEKEVKKLQNELKETANTSKKDEEKLATELQDLREKLKQSAAAKQEVDAKLIAIEHLYNELKEQQNSSEKNKNEAAERLRESDQTLNELRQQKAQLNEMLQRYQQNEVSLAEIDNELNRTKNENDILRAQLAESTQKSSEALSELKKLQAAHEQLQAANENLNEQLAQLKTQNEQQTASASSEALKVELAQMQQAHAKELEELRTQLNAKEKELKSSGNKVAKQKKQHETQQNKIKEQNVELDKLREELNQHAEHLEKLQNDATAREEQTEAEKAELKAQISSILAEISNMEEQMRVVQQSHAELEQEKRQLEMHIENLQSEHENVEASKLFDLEKKLQSLELENTQLTERNCLLQENVQRLEKQLAEEERLQKSESATIESELRAKLETAEAALQRLNEKMAQVLDENSRLHNAQELMEHDQRTLQDKCDAMEKSKLLAEDMLRDLTNEMERLRNVSVTQQELINNQLTEIRQQNALMENLTNALQQAGENVEQLELQLSQQIARNGELMELDGNKVETLKEKEKENEMLKAQLNDYELNMLEFERLREENALNIAQREQLEQELIEKTNEIMLKIERIQELEANQSELDGQLRVDYEQQHHLLAEKQNEIEKLREQMGKNVRERTEEHESLRQELTELIELEHRAVEQLEESKAEQKRQIDELELRLQAAQVDIERLHENNVSYEVEIEQLQAKHANELQELNATLLRLQDEHTKLQTQIEATQAQANKIKEYDELKIENEYLDKHSKQLEAELAAQKTKTAEECAAIDELREKLKSLQCELYVLKEKAEAHQAEVALKATELLELKEHEQQLKTALENEKIELQRQVEHAAFVTQQNDGVQKQLLQLQKELQETIQNSSILKTEMETQANDYKLKCEEIEKIETENLKLKNDLAALKIALIEANQNQTIEVTTTAAAAAKSTNNDEQLRELNAKLQLELEQLKERSTAEITHLQHEIDDLSNNVKQRNERIEELENVKANYEPTAIADDDHVDILKEKYELEAKLKEIMHEVQEVSNRNLFLEQQCENYLILEQSNERLKSQNAKLSRQLDETLVSMQHNDGLNANTEFEYLKNIMFQYFTGSSNGNNETLVKVISAVLKFSPQQTQVALEKEHQRRSLLNKIL